MSKRWLGLLILLVSFAGGGVAHATITATPLAIDAGPVPVGSFGTGQTTLTDDVNESVTLVLDTGGECDRFQITSPTSLMLSNTGSAVIVRFTPAAVTQSTCKISVIGAGPVTLKMIDVSGDGTAATPVLSVSPAGPLAFGTIEVGHPSTPPVTVTATNTGNAPLTITTATINTGTSNYNLSAPVGTQPIPPSGTLRWTISCDPAAQGTANGNFQIVSNAPTNGTVNVGLTCSGEEAVLATDVPSIDFGALVLSGVRTRPVKLTNTGNVDIVSNLAASFDKPGYSIDPSTPLPTTLASGAFVDLLVRFAPVLATDGGAGRVTFSGKWGAGAANTASKFVTLAGTTIDVGVLPANGLNFNDFPFDSAPTRVFQVKNGGGTPVGIDPLVFFPDAGTATGEVVIESIKVGNATRALPTTLAANTTLDVTIKAVPANRMGTVSGHFVMHSTTAGIPDQNLNVTGNATAATITTTNVDFGPTDLDDPAVHTQTATIANGGTGPLTISSITPLGVTGAFTVTAAAGQVAPGSSMPITITYKPTTTRAADNPDMIALTVSFTGVIGGPPTSTILVTGRGIDRVFVLGDMPVFPTTFRNPGTQAPVRTVSVRNGGEAVLKITELAIAGDPVWSLLDAAPVDIAGGASHDFMVRFAPSTISDALPGQLTITSNDNGNPTTIIPLTGSSIARDVVFESSTIDVGYVGIGIPTAVDFLGVVNRDASNDFTIHAIELTGGDTFRIADASDVALERGSTKQFALTVSPTTAGPFETTATLFLDQDPIEQGHVTITGNAVFVDAHGSGGCDAGGARGAGGLAIGLAALLVGRRRRRIAPAALAALVVAAPVAHADGVDLAVFAPTPATTGTGFQLRAPDVGAPGSWAVSSVLSFASKPLVLEAFTPDGQSISTDALVERSTQLRLGAAFAFRDRFEVGADLPLYTQSGQDQGEPQEGVTPPPVSGNAIGNLALHGKVRLARAASRAGAFGLGAGATITIPTATDGQFTGADEPAVRLLLLAAFTPTALASRLTISLNGGGVLRGKTEYANIAQQSAVAWGVGASFRIIDPLWATAEVFGEATPSGKRGQGAAGDMPPAELLSPVEWLAGVHVQAGRQVAIGLAGGRGLTSALGTPEVRGVLSLSFVPRATRLAPIHGPETPRFDGDADGDGVRDSVDKCPDEAEDKDMFDDADGCPDPDNDHDGVPDAQDKCPIDAEDKDGFEDGDGCPDRDNDGDGIPDAQDKCPNDPEDKDGFQDLDGCPDPDNDRDGIPDDKDKCPNEPETINGLADDDGCPDKGDSTILLSPDRIEMLDPVQFAGGRLTRASLGLLAQVAATLRAHTEIVRVRITVHVQPTRDSDADQARSEVRARAVRDWLVQWGIAASRVEARGFGGSKPLVPPDRRGAAKVNDRLELIILERK